MKIKQNWWHRHSSETTWIFFINIKVAICLFISQTKSKAKNIRHLFTSSLLFIDTFTCLLINRFLRFKFEIIGDQEASSAINTHTTHYSKVKFISKKISPQLKLYKLVNFNSINKRSWETFIYSNRIKTFTINYVVYCVRSKFYLHHHFSSTSTLATRFYIFRPSQYYVQIVW